MQHCFIIVMDHFTLPYHGSTPEKNFTFNASPMGINSLVEDVEEHQM